MLPTSTLPKILVKEDFIQQIAIPGAEAEIGHNTNFFIAQFGIHMLCSTAYRRVQSLCTRQSNEK